MKIANRIKLQTIVLIISILLATNLIIYILFTSLSTGMVKNSLYQKEDEIIELLTTSKSSEQMSQELAKINMETFLPDETYLRIIDENGKIIFEDSNEKQLLDEVQLNFLPARNSFTKDIELDNVDEEMLVTNTSFIVNKNLYNIQMGTVLVGYEQKTVILKVVLILSLVITSLLAYFGVSFFTKRLLSPMANITNTMREIEASGIIKQIDYEYVQDDELKTIIDTFNKMMIRIDQNIKKQEQFISDASHELKTPLTVMKVYTNFLSKRVKIENEDAKEALTVIENEIVKMQSLVQNLLDVAMTTNNYQMDYAKININNLTKELVKAMQPIYKRNIAVVNSESMNPTVELDCSLFKQLLIIILDNSIKYSKDDIEIMIRKKETDVQICISDLGPGVSPEHLEQIFDRFYRVDESRTKAIGGTGLGLNIAQNIVKMHNGRIYAQNNDPHGLKIIIELPLTKLINKKDY